MPVSTHPFLLAGSACSALIEAFPWQNTSLGELAAWPVGLKTTISMILRSPVPIVTLWDNDGYMIYNDAYSVFAGGRHPVLLGSKVREGWPEVADFNDNVMRVVMQGCTLSYTDQELTLHRSGKPEPVWMNLDYSPVVYEDGTIAGVIAVVIETSAKVRAEQALRESEAKFRTFAQAMPHHVWTAPGDGRLDWFNDRVYEYSGAQPGDLDGDAWASIVFPDDRAEAFRRWQKSVDSGNAFEAQFRLRRRDGVYRWHLARAITIGSGSGNGELRWIGSSTDVEEQKVATEALARLNATLEMQVSQRTAERDRMWRLSKDIMLVADFQAKLTAVNPAFSALLGWSDRDVLGTSFMDLVHPDDRDATLRQVASLSSGVQVFRFENRYRRQDGSYCSLAWTASPDDGHIHAVGRDITADLQQAEAMRNTELALHQAQKMETIGKLTGGVAHDFNNLLQVISGNLQLMAPAVQHLPAVQRRLESALAGVDRGAKLASYLLAFARKQPLAPKVVKLGRVISAIEDMLRRALGEEIDVETVISGGLWSTSIDVAQLENALLNLAVNARDAMDGRGRLTIEVNNASLDDSYCTIHPEVTPGQYVVVAVSDTGTGMTPEVMRQAFEPFFSTKAEGKGTGLGLSMVYGLIKQSGGHIKLYSELGEGTTIKLYLPRSHDVEDAYVAVDVQPVIGGTETILVAEDDEEVRTTVVDMLTELGYRVLKACDAAAALTVIESGMPIDLLFTDVVMPGPLRSPDLARKARERLPALAVLFTSGYTENAIVHGGRLDPGVELIGKPYTRESLARKIRHVLANEAQKRQGAQAVAVPAVTPAAGPVVTPGTVAAHGATQADQIAGLPADMAAAAAAVAPAGLPALRVLLVDDEEQILANTRDMLLHLGCEVVTAPTAEEAQAMLHPAPDVLITDLQLPGMQGSDLAVLAKAQLPQLQVVIASGLGDASLPADTRHLPKPYSLEQLRQMLQSLNAPAPSRNPA